jgi:2-oxo-4-hydroxy-4-carboxy-5-ureidoimidazoline decarboxylase
VTLVELNALNPARFATALRGVFEHSPWIAAEASERRPFASIDALHAALLDIVRNASPEAQLGLLRAHPEVASKAAIRGELTTESSAEQTDAGLTRCSPAEFSRLHALNRAYDAKFGFPFIIAVKGLGPAGIIARCEERLERSREAEFAEALEQVGRIARFRLEALLERQRGSGSTKG